jgi:transcriptional regulator with XRE-family HTH domain
VTPEELRAARAALRLTQAQLAALLGVRRNNVVRWEMARTPNARPIPPMAESYVRHLLACTPITEPKP